MITRTICAGLLAFLAVSALAGERRIDAFRDGLDQWVVEMQPGGAVAAENGVLRIDDAAGCTVWYKPRLEAPVVIRYEARVRSDGRVSDLNCFWMATDPTGVDVPAARRDGKFASYDSLRTYYVGYGGNENTTTRFRRYDGTGARPLDPSHDLRAPEYLLRPDHWYRIELHVTADGRVRYVRDGETIFDFLDPAPLRTGWFGFRTVHSRIEARNFSVTAPEPPAAPR